MEGRVSRGRGGSWRRGGRGGTDGESVRGDHRGRGRGGQHRGRGRRDHYRGRGRGHAPGFPPRDTPVFQDEDDEGQPEEEDARMAVFSRRKLESNWDRYKDSEKAEQDDDTPTQRGADYHVMLGSAGDSFTQFRFAEEKDWEMDPLTACQMSAVCVDLPALAQILQELPLHQRLGLEAELLQVSTPVELPAVTVVPKQETPKTSKFTPLPPPPPPAACKRVEASAAAVPDLDPQVSHVPAESAVDDGDEELDQLLGLQKPDSGAAEQPLGGGCEENAAPETSEENAAPETSEENAAPETSEENAAPETMSEVKVEPEEKEEVKEEAPPECASSKEEMTEEDLEDWLDSMIS
ncbi:cell death regulator Aven isoform X2 [Cololabis saira]|uniref:cell death regulator Aven isoform X2 n=1 Tax=Cololabis saira TaxID=129043 RepID=UPI002AD5401A|nr:cell death regulator Aven isoform X2 [Cololabis saira]